MKKKIYFLAPKNEWWTYFYYKEITNYLIQNFADTYEVYFCNSFKDYLKLHFIKSDIIFSIIPFLFKPVWAEKYFFNLHWNYKIERKNKWIWVKLLFLAELNLWFCDRIILTSYYLANKLNFRDKYIKKIEILPNFINKIEKNKKVFDKNVIHLLTISSSNFLEKWLWVYELATQIFKINNLNINWKIILPWNKENRWFILDQINSIEKSINIKIETFDFIQRDKLDDFYRNSDIFVYASNLETWGWVIMEACSFWKPIILIKNDVWEYIYPNEFITNDLEDRLKQIINNFALEKEKTYEFIKKYQIKHTIKKIIDLIDEIWNFE